MCYFIFLYINKISFLALYNLNYNKIDITPNTFNSHRLIRWSLPYNKQSELLDFLFIAYFEEGKNIGDTDILLQISEELNLNKDDIKESFLNDIDRKEVEAEEWSFRDLGIAGVPTYIINKEIIITGAQSSDNFVKLFLYFCGASMCDPSGRRK